MPNQWKYCASFKYHVVLSSHTLQYLSPVLVKALQLIYLFVKLNVVIVILFDHLNYTLDMQAFHGGRLTFTAEAWKDRCY